jgi:hypothetical protein
MHFMKTENKYMLAQSYGDIIISGVTKGGGPWVKILFSAGASVKSKLLLLKLKYHYMQTIFFCIHQKSPEIFLTYIPPGGVATLYIYFHFPKRNIVYKLY